MPSHGNHWETLLNTEESDFLANIVIPVAKNGRVVCAADCEDVRGGTERAEHVICQRSEGEHLVTQTLTVTDSLNKTLMLFSAYPVVLDGIPHNVTFEKFEPWKHGIEGWIHGGVMSGEASISFFDTMYFASPRWVRVGETVTYHLAGLAYWLRPIQTRTLEISEGPMWEIEKQNRLEAGETLQEAERPVTIHMTGAAMLLPVHKHDDAPDDYQFQGVIDALEVFEHGGQKIWRLELVLMRSIDNDDEVFRLPVYASEYALQGYVPRLGEDVEGIMWLQGRQLEADECKPENLPS